MQLRKQTKDLRGPLAVVAIVVTAVAAFLVISPGGPRSEGATTSPTTAVEPAIALQQDFVHLVNVVRPSVVQISTGSGLGSGVIYDTKGDIVTNAHVVGSATSFTVTFSTGKSTSATLVGSYAPDDLAVIRATPPKGVKPASFGNSATLRSGDLVLAIGNPLGLSGSVTDGIVSSTGRTVSEGNGVLLTGLVQTSAAINPGNSGGALANLADRVVGIPTLAATNGAASAPGLGFAIPANTVKLIAPQLIARGKVTNAGRAALGISGSDGLNSSGQPIGVVVAAVAPNGPAAKAGIAVGELITGINGESTTTFTDLQTALAKLRPGAKVKVSVTNASGQQRTVTVTLGDLAQQ